MDEQESFDIDQDKQQNTVQDKEQEVTQIAPTPLPTLSSHKKLGTLLVTAFVLLVAGSVAAAYFFVNQRNDREPAACTAEAKICPDGSSVGRTGPNCEFAECPVPIYEGVGNEVPESEPISNNGDSSKKEVTRDEFLKLTAAPPISINGPRVINCNPSSYNRDYFLEYVNCTSDMTLIDIERQIKALDILEQKAKRIWSNSRLYVTDERYVVMELSLGEWSLAIVDLDDEELIDWFDWNLENRVVNSSSFLMVIQHSDDWNVQVVKQYVFGESSTEILKNSELFAPLSYYRGVGEVSRPTIVSSSTESITIGIYDSEKISKTYYGGEDYELVDKKTFEL